MSFSVNVRLGEVSATTSLSELSATVTISGGLPRSIPFSANKDTELDFSDTITFSVDNPSPDVEYIWRLEDVQGTNTKLGTQVKQDYTEEGQYDVKVLGHYLDQKRLEGVGYEKDFVKVDFKFQAQLLNDVPGAAAAYSVRLLDQNYTDGLLRVRAVDSNGTDQGEADVKHDGVVLNDGSLTISLNSPIENLDSVASDPNGRGLSNSDTLGDLVDSGGSNYDGFVPKWYEQSPNARHATNSTASEQPQLVSAGRLVLDNNKPALDYNRSGQVKLKSTTFTISQPNSFFLIHNAKPEKTVDITSLNLNKRNQIYHDDTGGDIKMNAGNLIISGAPLGYRLVSTFFDNNNSEGYVNGVLEVSGDSGSNAMEGIVIGDKFTNDGYNGKFQEVIWYGSDKRAERGKIETNQNNFFNAF